MASKNLSLPGSRLLSDNAYLRRQASEERTAALHCINPKARDRHLAKALRYESQVRANAAHELNLKVRKTEFM